MGKKKNLTLRRKGHGDFAEKKTNMERTIERARRLVRKHVRPGTSLVDELIAERRGAGRNE